MRTSSPVQPSERARSSAAAISAFLAGAAWVYQVSVIDAASESHNLTVAGFGNSAQASVALESYGGETGPEAVVASGNVMPGDGYADVFGFRLELPERGLSTLRNARFVAGSALFTVGTLVAAAAADQWVLVAGRVVQGAGAAALSPAAMSLLMLTFPGPQRARAMSLWGAASAVGGATGVFAGGLLAGGYVFMVLGKAFGAGHEAPKRVVPVARSREVVALSLALCAVLLGFLPLQPSEFLQIGRPELAGAAQ